MPNDLEIAHGSHRFMMEQRENGKRIEAERQRGM